MALDRWPVTPDPWLLKWLIWRFKGKPGSSPAPSGDLPKYAHEVLAYVSWKRRGKPDPRPDISRQIPPWAESMYKGVNQAVPIALPDRPHTWLLSWAIWRFRGSNPTTEPSHPPDLSVSYPYVWSYLRWLGWRRKGGPLPRPADVPSSVPQWAWQHLEHVNLAVPPGPLPPPPPPPGPTPQNSWHLPDPIIWTTWGWMTDWQTNDAVDAIAAKMRFAGVRTIALQIGQYPEWLPDELERHGFKVALWGIPSLEDNQALADVPGAGYIPQIETPDQYQAAITNLEAGYGAGRSVSVVTTLFGLDTFTSRPDGDTTTVEVERLIKAGCTHGWIECYKQDPGDAHYPISKMMWQAERKGFYYASPLVGLYRDIGFEVYHPEVDQYGIHVGGYTAETMRPVDWEEFRKLGA